MGWFDRNNTNNEPGGTATNTPPLELTEDQLKKIADNVAEKMAASHTAAINASLEANPILKRLGESLSAADRAKAERQRQQQQTQTQAQNTEYEQAFGELDENVQKVINTQFTRLEEQNLRNGARETRRSVFEDVENFQYYTGDIKRKVDEMLDGEPLSAQNNPLVVRNAYKVVLADHIQELQEKKLKSRLSGATGSSTTANISTPDPNKLPELTAEEKRYASNMGISEEDWAKSKKDMILAGEVQGV